MYKYYITKEKLLSEYMNFDATKGGRFGQYIFNKYGDINVTDNEVFYEPNNGTAYKLILGRLNQK